MRNPFGWIGKFVKQGNTFGILVNSPWVNPGTYTSPDMALRVAQLCYEAGAKEVVCFKLAGEGFCEESHYFDKQKK